jgi:lipopolysaccharide/colanic/teichoic acid biosynthesis glycosyltransferase
MQRILDIFLSILGLVFISPILVPIIIILRFSGEGEIFYLQPRIGLNGNLFNIIKLATMLKNSENMGAGTLTLKNDPRVLPIGRFLRKSKINELPQLFNILLGDMSIVGPRPLVPEGESFYTENQSKLLRSVRPGVTGIGSLVLRDEESYYAHRSDSHEFYKSVISPYKASVEMWYVQNKSIFVDSKIVLLTIFSILVPSLKVSLFFQSLPLMPKELYDSKEG